MFTKAALILLLKIIPIISARNWTYHDATALTLHLTNTFETRCVILTHSSKISLKQNMNKMVFLNKVSKITQTWHPVVGSTTFEDVVDAEVNKRKNGLSNCLKPIFIIFEYEALKTDLEALSNLIQFSGAIWLLVMNLNVDASFFANMRINVKAEFYIAGPIEKTGRSVFSEVYAVGYERIMEIVDLGYWSKENGLILTAPKFFLRRRNLRGQVLKTASVENWPITSFDQNQFSKDRVIDGFYARLWFDLEVLMNFSTTFQKTTAESTGLEISDGIFNGLIGMAQRHEVDVVLSELTMTPRRWTVIDLIQPLVKTRYQVYFRLNDGEDIEWFSIFRPFETNVWIAIISTIAVCSCFLYWINCKANHLEIGENFTLKLSDSFFLILQTFCSQGTDTVPQRNTFRICLLFSYLTAAVILPSYSAALTSALSKKTETKPYDDIEGFLKTKTALLVWPNSADYEVFSQADSPVFQEAFEVVNPKPDMKKLQDYAEMLEYVCNSSTSVAAFGVEPGVQVKLRDLERQGYRCRIAGFTNGVFSSYQTIGFVKKSPYSAVINMNLMSFRERGLVKRYEKQYIPTWVKNVVDPTFEVTISEVASIFALLLSGIVLSSFILVFECLYYNSRQSPNFIVVFDYRH